MHLQNEQASLQYKIPNRVFYLKFYFKFMVLEKYLGKIQELTEKYGAPRSIGAMRHQAISMTS